MNRLQSLVSVAVSFVSQLATNTAVQIAVGSFDGVVIERKRVSTDIFAAPLTAVPLC